MPSETPSETLDEAVDWYHRPELRGPWTISACDKHGGELAPFGFVRGWPTTQADPDFYPPGCAVCLGSLELGELARCSCVETPEACPLHPPAPGPPDPLHPPSPAPDEAAPAKLDLSKLKLPGEAADPNANGTSAISTAYAGAIAALEDLSARGNAAIEALARAARELLQDDKASKAQLKERYAALRSALEAFEAIRAEFEAFNAPGLIDRAPGKKTTSE